MMKLERERVVHLLSPHKLKYLPLLLAGGYLLVNCMACMIAIPILTLPPKNDVASKQLLPSAESGNATDQYRLALAYRYGIAGVKKDLAASSVWLHRAAEGAYEPARVDVADALLFGDYGSAKDVAQGLAAWRELASKGSGDAAFKFATRLSDSRKLWADPKEAAAWYEAAARGGHRYAAYKLAQQLETGRGATRDLPRAYAFYRYGRAVEDAQRLESTLSAEQLQVATGQWRALEKKGRP